MALRTVFVFCQEPRHEVSENITSVILILKTKGKWVMCFTFWPLCYMRR